MLANGRGSRWALSAAAAFAAVALTGFATAVVLAAPPTTGTVVEGKSVPGVALGASRRQVQAAWGTPTFCQSGSHSGDRALCTWQRSDGSVDLAFLARGGGDPTGRNTDVVARAIWTDLPGWRTTAGVTAPQALNDPESVPPAYPGAQVSRYGNGHLLQVLDRQRGIEVDWAPVPYTGEFTVRMSIFRPTT